MPFSNPGRFLLGLWLFLSVPTCLFAGSAVLRVETPGLSIAFSEQGKPVSVTSSSGEELLNPEASKGFFLRQFGDRHGAKVFDRVERVNERELAFGFRDGSPESIQVNFSGHGDQLRMEFTRIEGFPLQGESLRFEIWGKEDYLLNAVALDWMIEDNSGNTFSWPDVRVERRSLWEINEQNPLGAFIVYHRQNKAQEDEVLFDIWLNEPAFPKPGTEEPWTRARAERWLDDFIELQYDNSVMGLYPRNPKELREFFPYAKLADAKGFHINFRRILSHQIDVPHPDIFPGGMADLQQFARDAKANGQRLFTHRMSAGIWYVDPEYVTGPKGLHPDFEGIFTMEVAKEFKPGDTELFLKADPAVKMPIIWKGPGARPPYPYPYLPGSFRMGHYDIGGQYVPTDTLPEKLDDKGNWVLKGAKLASIKRSLDVGTRVKHLLRGNAFFIPEYNSAFFEEIAVRYANFANDVPLYDVSTDGAAWYMARGHWAFEKFMTLVYETMKHPTIPAPSHAKIPYAWIEYRFNRTRDALGAPFSVRGGTALHHGNPMRASTGLEFIFDGVLMGNSRCIGITHDLVTSLDALEARGDIVEMLTAVKDVKNASFAMGPEQRERMNRIQHRDVDRVNPHTTKIWGTFYGEAVWWVEGSLFRLWWPVVSPFYENKYYRGMEHGSIPPRMYVQAGEEQELVVPEAAREKTDQVRIVGRLLPRFEEDHPENVDLLAAANVEPGLVVSRENSTEKTDTSLNNRNDMSNFTTYPTSETINMVPNRGVGIRVVGDGSGSLLVIRLTNGRHRVGRGRDFVFPVNFTGERWLIAPDPEQGWRPKNWGWSGASTKTAGAEINQVSIGLGFVPANTKTSVKILELKALHNIHEPLVDPRFRVGNTVVDVKGSSVGTYNFFELSADGQFNVYDPYFFLISSTSIGESFHPEDLSTFSFDSSASPPGIWMETAVQVATETEPNPAESSTVIWRGGPEGDWSTDTNWDRGTSPDSADNVIIGSRATVRAKNPAFNMLTVRAGASLHTGAGCRPGQRLNIFGTLNVAGTCDLSGATTRLAGALGKDVKAVALNNGSLSLYHGARFEHAGTDLQIGGKEPELRFVLSPTGFQTVRAGILKGKDGWQNLRLRVDLQDFHLEGDEAEIVLMDFDAHEASFDSLTAETDIVSRDLPLTGSLFFDQEASRLLLKVRGASVE